MVIVDISVARQSVLESFDPSGGDLGLCYGQLVELDRAVMCSSPASVTLVPCRFSV